MEELIEIRVRMIRQQRGLYLVDVAELAGLSKTFLSDAERGHAELRISHLARLARVLGVTPWDLITFRDFAPLCRGTPLEHADGQSLSVFWFHEDPA